MSTVSVVFSVFNEEALLEDALKSVQFADEIIVMNNSSTDGTEKIAKKYTDKVFTQKNDPQKIDLQKNTGFSKASSDWVLSLDADERITPELEKEILAVLERKASKSKQSDSTRKYGRNSTVH
jgi:glycosyltransferase involved in cell wall biosynthesis